MGVEWHGFACRRTAKADPMLMMRIDEEWIDEW
jgi:hypothetical protein